MVNFKLSTGNSKLGKITNINLSTDICKDLGLPCYGAGCYACKGRYRMKNVQDRYTKNTEAYFTRHSEFTKKEILNQLPKKGRVRWHASGEIPDTGYFIMMVEIARERPDLTFLAYTKRYKLVNTWLNLGHTLPCNLNIVFSGWTGLEMDNPHNLPVAVIKEHNPDITNKRSFPCSGSCINCHRCWHLKQGDAIIFGMH